MTLEQRYEFDVNGYIIYRSVLSQEELTTALTPIINIHGATGNGKFSFFEHDPFFMELMSREITIGILKVLLGEWLRFDHAFGIQMTQVASVLENLHAGPLQNQRAFWYQWGPGNTMHNGLIKVLYALNDVNAGDGGFICVPGSHKANLLHRPQHDSHMVVNPQMKAGDMLVFTEALVHGSRQWTGEQPRRVLIYSYGPGCMAWKEYSTISEYLTFATTPLQRDLLRPPYVGNYDGSEADSSGRWPKNRRTPVVDM